MSPFGFVTNHLATLTMIALPTAGIAKVPFFDDLMLLQGDLLRFARLQLRDTASAEDAVQETLIAALAGAQGFENRASLKSWVFSILRNKIVDLIRIRSREMAASSIADDEAADEALTAELFDQVGHWQREATPGRWNDPEASFEQQQFWAIFEACLDHLPEKTARIFMMREFLGLETEEICKETGVSSSNCWVVLHRARAGLRVCLEQKWFDGATKC